MKCFVIKSSALDGDIVEKLYKGNMPINNYLSQTYCIPLFQLQAKMQHMASVCQSLLKAVIVYH